MPDYKSLYLKLFRAHSKAIQILTQAGQEAEEILLDSKDPLDLFETLGDEMEETDEE